RLARLAVQLGENRQREVPADDRGRLQGRFFRRVQTIDTLRDHPRDRAGNPYALYLAREAEAAVRSGDDTGIDEVAHRLLHIQRVPARALTEEILRLLERRGTAEERVEDPALIVFTEGMHGDSGDFRHVPGAFHLGPIGDQQHHRGVTDAP